MEDALALAAIPMLATYIAAVLILVLMEDALAPKALISETKEDNKS